MKKMKVALVYDAVYPYTGGGGERRFYEIAKQLTLNGHDVHLYGMKYWEGPKVITTENGITLHGICKARPLYNKDGRRVISQALIFGVSCSKLMFEPFDRIDCCGFPYFSLFACKVICVLRRKKLYATWHEVWGKAYWREYLGKLGFIGFAIERLAVKMPNHIIAVSPETGDRIKNELRFKHNIDIIPNGIDSKSISRVMKSSQSSDIIYVGRLIDTKNVDLLLKAIVNLKLSLPKIQCLIIGDGPEKTKLKRMRNKLGLVKNVDFLGRLTSGDDVYGYMKSSKVLVLPSTREGFGMVIVEANAVGLPAVTIDHPSNAARNLIVEGSNGYLAKFSQESLATSIMRTLNSKAKMHPKSYSKNFEWQDLSRKLEKVMLTD